jgi:hypothetical protein
MTSTSVCSECERSDARRENCGPAEFCERIVISNDVDLSAAGLIGKDVAKERDKFLARMTRGRFAENFTCCSIEGGMQREASSMATFHKDTTWRVAEE